MSGHLDRTQLSQYWLDCQRMWPEHIHSYWSCYHHCSLDSPKTWPLLCAVHVHYMFLGAGWFTEGIWTRTAELKRKRSVSVCHTGCAFTYSAPFNAGTPALSSFPFIFQFLHSSSHSPTLVEFSVKLINFEKDIFFIAKSSKCFLAFPWGYLITSRFSFFMH